MSNAKQETIADIAAKMRGLADRIEKRGLYDLRECGTDYLRALADLIEAAIKREREAVDKVVREMGGCCAVRVNCCNCGKGEEVFFVPKNLITKLKLVIAQGADNEQ